MNHVKSRSLRVLVGCLAALAVVAIGGVVIASRVPREAADAVVPEKPTEQSCRLAEGLPQTLDLSPELAGTLGVRTAQARRATSHDRLSLSGSLFLDPNRLVRVHSRFAGEVVSLGTLATDGAVPSRALRLGDRVTKGQLLAVIWSKDVGEKKSDLVNALSKQYLDEAQLKSLRTLGKDVVAQRQVREAERERESDVIEVDRVERTLRSWRLTEAEIAVVRAEAEKIHRGDVSSDMNVDNSWAEVEVRSPFDGVILEKNIVAGDIVDTTLDLFKIADMNVLGVMANVYEEDLPKLEALVPAERRWSVQLKSQPDASPIDGTFDLIGSIVDPNQHTAAVMGWLDNRDGRLRAGQFITAAIELPVTDDEVMIPDTALVEGADSGTVLVASDESARQVTRRKVALVARGPDVAYVRSVPCDADAKRGCCALQPGEWVVTTGAVELDGALDNALASAAKTKPANP